jgi:hypothetical protein
MPVTKPMGSNAATMQKVARIVGLPTSRTASMAIAVDGDPFSSQRR